MSVILTVIFILLLNIILYLLLNKQKYKKGLAAIPGPCALPIIGNTYMLKSCADIVNVSKNLRNQYGGLFKIFIGPSPRLIICEQKSAEFLLSSQIIIEKSYEYNFFHAWLGTGLLTSTDAKWKSRRKLLTPTFHFKILEKYISIFNNSSDVLVEKLKTKVNAGPFDIFPLVTLCTLDIICEAAMGTKINAQEDSNSPYVLSVKEMLRIITERTFSPIKMFDILFKLTSMHKQQKQALSILHGFTNSVIRNRKQNFKKQNMHDINDDGVTKRVAFLDLLLQCNLEREVLSDEAIREEVDTFMFEGHDTTSSGISFTLYCLSQNPDVQQRVYEEIQAIFGNDHSISPTYQNLQEMKYLELVIKESLRLYPPVPSFSRILNQDAEFDDKIKLPKGLTLTLYALLLHRDPSVFPDPEKFDPDRFLPENSTTRSPYAYVPFSAGSRNCIGQRFAMLELKSTVLKIIRQFELLPVYNHTPDLCVEAILKSYNGLPIRLKLR